MEADLVNVFIQKQKDIMIDLLMRNVLLDSRITLAESKIQSLVAIEEQHEIAINELAKAKEEITGLQKEISNYKTLISKQQAAR